MIRTTLLDTGPLVAYLSRADGHHHWSVARFSEVPPPLLTCEPVITEASHLLRRAPGGVPALMELMERKVIAVGFALAEEHVQVAGLLKRYENIPMSLADGCLVRMSEKTPECRVLTLDRHFLRYRRNGRQVIPAIMPDSD